MEDSDLMEDPDRCTATASSTGERCKQSAIPGGNVCRFHGGAAEQVQKKAQERLDRMADEVTADVQAIIDDMADLYEEADVEEKLAIQREMREHWEMILDRTGHEPGERHEHEHGGEITHNVRSDVVEVTEDDVE